MKRLFIALFVAVSLALSGCDSCMDRVKGECLDAGHSSEVCESFADVTCHDQAGGD